MPHAVTKADIDHLAALSSLTLSKNEVESLQKDISLILAHIDQLAELDTANIKPTYQVTGLTNVWREDELQQDIRREQLLQLAPAQHDNHIKVPKVL